MTDRTKSVTVPQDRCTSRAIELPELTLRKLEDPSKSKRVSNPAKPFPHRSESKKGVRFLPATAEDFRTTQHYLQALFSKDPAVTWYCYTPAAEHPTKVCARSNTNIQEIRAALKHLDYPAIYA
ncbi:hypothetical protein EVAR_79541_1 [Eumeta japonica]|uniref:Nucleic-acid-binding protein from transposon X-element n=1 Tax=Eumeta variegata TaxID=151549 RepID=A0A4C1Y9G8_EUMVA|nr:hypothetical protein EVAR_79541_1 [Eumeta japonica]